MKRFSDPRPYDPDSLRHAELDANRRCRNNWSEFGWGARLVPRGFEDKPPAGGGRYRARVADRVRANAPAGRKAQ